LCATAAAAAAAAAGCAFETIFQALAHEQIVIMILLIIVISRTTQNHGSSMCSFDAKSRPKNVQSKIKNNSKTWRVTHPVGHDSASWYFDGYILTVFSVIVTDTTIGPSACYKAC
jgi:short subunit fatty acids transporter